MIVAHHMGEDVLVTAAAGGASAVPLLVALARARLRELGRTLRRRR